MQCPRQSCGTEAPGRPAAIAFADATNCIPRPAPPFHSTRPSPTARPKVMVPTSLVGLVRTMPQDRDPCPRSRSVLRAAFVIFYGAAGVVHLWAPDAFLPIVPLWVPFPREVVLATGLCELAGAAALLTRRLRPLAGIMLALYAVCVFPANIRHAVEGIEVRGLPSSWWYHAPRLAMQPVLVWAVLFCTRVTDWPFRR